MKTVTLNIEHAQELARKISDTFSHDETVGEVVIALCLLLGYAANMSPEPEENALRFGLMIQEFSQLKPVTSELMS